MEKKVFEESLSKLVPACGKEAVQSWVSFAEDSVSRGRYPDDFPIPDRKKAVEKWLEAIYNGLYRAKQEYGAKPIEQICELSIRHGLYPWEMVEAAMRLTHGIHPDQLIWPGLGGMPVECDPEPERNQKEDSI